MEKPASKRVVAPVSQSVKPAAPEAGQMPNIVQAEIMESASKMIVNALKTLDVRFTRGSNTNSDFYHVVRRVVSAAFETVNDPDPDEVKITRIVLEKLKDAIRERSELTPNGTAAVFDAMQVAVCGLINQLDFTPRIGAENVQEFTQSARFWGIWGSIIIYHNALGIQTPMDAAGYIEMHAWDKGMRAEMAKIRKGLVFVDKPGNFYAPREPANVDSHIALRDGFA